MYTALLIAISYRDESAVTETRFTCKLASRKLSYDSHWFPSGTIRMLVNPTSPKPWNRILPQ